MSPKVHVTPTSEKFEAKQWDSEGRSLFYTNLEKKSKNALPSRLMGACRATGYLGIANLQEISMVKKFATFRIRT